jgi:hypothetical protein
MWSTSVVLAGGLGLLLGWEDSTFKNDRRYQEMRKGWLKLSLLLMFAASVGVQVASVRGFLVVYLSALGAYYLLKQVGRPLQVAWYRWRDPHPIFELSHRSAESGKAHLWISSKSTSPVHLETILLRDAAGKIVPISSGEVGDWKFGAERDGRLELADVVIASNGAASVALISDRWGDATTLRVIGQYSNDGYWIVEQAI